MNLPGWTYGAEYCVITGAIDAWKLQCYFLYYTPFLVTMWCSFHCIVRTTLLVAVAACILTSLLARSGIFVCVLKVSHLMGKQLGFIVHGHDDDVQHKNKCGPNNIYCTESTSQTARNRSYHVDRVFSGVVTSNVVTSARNAYLVLLGQLPRRSNGSMKHLNEQFIKTPSFSSYRNRTVFRSRELVIWSSDHHPAPAYAAKYLLQPLGVKFLQHDLSPYQYCSYFNTCQERNSLKVSSLVISNTESTYACEHNHK